MLIIQIPGETVRKFHPEHDSLGYGFRFADSEIEVGKILESRVRVFPLSGQTYYFPLDEGVDYDSALALLRNIEAGTIQRIKPKSEKTADGAWLTSVQAVGDITPDVLPTITTITTIRRGKTKNEIEVQTRTRAFGGKNYTFQQNSDGFLLIGVSSWVS